MLAVLLLSVLLSVRLSVLFSYQSNDLYTALQTAFEGIAVGKTRSNNQGSMAFGCR